VRPDDQGQSTAVRERGSVEWSTPQWFFERLDREFSFTLDVCASERNAKCVRYFTRGDDGLAQSWGRERCWMNPPYGREIGLWLAKALESSLGGALVVCLVPASTGARWWHDYVTKASELRFVRGRLRFGDAKHSAPFPSVVVVFRPAAPDSSVWVCAGRGDRDDETSAEDKAHPREREDLRRVA
jgi:site-specific DNA-methyltransferase (adenine-specific)